MTAERLSTFLRTLPHTVEWTQWGDLIYSVGDKAIDGKMFAMVSVLSPTDNRAQQLICSFAAGPERFHQLQETEGILPAPYFARIHWVAVQRWECLTNTEWEQELSAAHALTYNKLAPKTKKILALPKAEQKRVTTEARKRRAEKEAKKKADQA